MALEARVSLDPVYCFFVPCGLFGFSTRCSCLDVEALKEVSVQRKPLVRDLLPGFVSSAGKEAQECCFGICGCSVFICTMFYWSCFLSYSGSNNLVKLESIQVCVTDLKICV